MSGDMIRFITFNFILRILLRGVMCIAFVIEVPGMHFDDRAGNPSRLGIPTYFIAALNFVATMEFRCQLFLVGYPAPLYSRCF